MFFSYVQVSLLQQHQQDDTELKAGDRVVSEIQPTTSQDETDLLEEE